MSITPGNYNNKVKAYFSAVGLTPTADQLSQWSLALFENNGNVWRSGLQQFVSNTVGLGTETPDLATSQTIVQNMLVNIFGTTAGINPAIVQYYVSNLADGTILPRGLGNAMINDLGLMPKVDGTFGSPGGWNSGPAGVDSPSLVTPAQQNAFQNQIIPEPTPPVPDPVVPPAPGPAPAPPAPPAPEPGNAINLVAGVDNLTDTVATQAGENVNFRFSNVSQLVNALPGTLKTGDTLIDPFNTDQDILQVHLNGDNGLTEIGTPLVQGIENLMFVGDTAKAGILNMTSFTGVQTVTMTGSAAGVQEFANYNLSGASTFDFKALTGDAVKLDPSGAAHNTVYTIYGSGKSDVISLAGNTANGSHIYAGTGADTLTGGSGSDIFHIENNDGDSKVITGDGNNYVYGGANITTADTLTGGTGTDTLDLHGDYSAGLQFDGDFTKFDILRLNDGFSYKITTHDDNVAADATFTVNASALSATKTLDFDGSAETNGNFSITGGAGADTITGGAKDDVIITGEGTSRVTGRAGNDTINLTETVSAIDQVQFISGGATTIAAYAAANGSDLILGFNTANDRVVFAQALLAIDATATIAYQAGATDTAINAGTTVYEIAGTIGTAGAAGLVANLGTAATNADIDAGDALVFIQYTAGNNMEMYYFVDADGANVDEGELHLIATFSGIAPDSFAAANIGAAFA
ncbi:Hemolysin-type calcium-binding repeat-containing protein [Desulfonatronum zhilinae]|nr:Hemolysin-type calcium-binding repeat-containing protein [Desulfonatronum zhilinae]